MTSKKLNKIKSSLVSRGFSLAKMSLQAGAQLAGHSVGQILQSPSERPEKWKEFVKKQAQNLATELGELKGSLMKAGQMLSVYGEHFFPPEVNQLLRQLHQDSPPVEWSVIKKIIPTQLGPEKMDLLEIQHESIGTASLGQVHQAKIKNTNTLLALKIQYPGIDKAIDSDLKALKSLLSVTKILPKDFNSEPIFQEVREMLVQETDYETEAQLTQRYGDYLNGDVRFVVPRVFPEFSNRKILATSFEKGLRVDDPLIQNLSQDRRNRLGLHFMELYFKELFDWKLMQTDPHFGNYKIRVDQKGQDQLVLLDFGASKQLPESFMGPYHRMLKALFYNDILGFEQAAHDLQFLQDNDDPELKKLFADLCFNLVEPFLDPNDPRCRHDFMDDQGLYDWNKTDLPQRSSKKAFTIIQKFKWRTPPKEIIFLDRKAAGVFIFLSHLKVKVRGRELLESYLQRV